MGHGAGDPVRPQRTPDPFGTLTCDPLAPGDNGNEWEIRTYLHFVL